MDAAGGSRGDVAKDRHRLLKGHAHAGAVGEHLLLQPAHLQQRLIPRRELCGVVGEDGAIEMGALEQCPLLLLAHPLPPRGLVPFAHRPVACGDSLEPNHGPEGMAGNRFGLPHIGFYRGRLRARVKVQVTTWLVAPGVDRSSQDVSANAGAEVCQKPEGPSPPPRPARAVTSRRRADGRNLRKLPSAGATPWSASNLQVPHNQFVLGRARFRRLSHSVKRFACRRRDGALLRPRYLAFGGSCAHTIGPARPWRIPRGVLLV